MYELKSPNRQKLFFSTSSKKTELNWTEQQYQLLLLEKIYILNFHFPTLFCILDFSLLLSFLYYYAIEYSKSSFYD